MQNRAANVFRISQAVDVSWYILKSISSWILIKFVTILVNDTFAYAWALAHDWREDEDLKVSRDTEPFTFFD